MAGSTSDWEVTAVLKFSSLPQERVLFRSEGDVLVLVKKDMKMFRMFGDNLSEISAPDIKHKIVLESSVIDESVALKEAAMA